MNMNMSSGVKYVYLTLMTLNAGVYLCAQDVQFSQFYTAKFKIPSFAGTAEDGRLTIISRDQWPFLKNTYYTLGFGVDYYVPVLNGGIGFYGIQDYSNGGAYIITNTGIQYSYEVALDRGWQFRPGLQINCINRNIDFDKITFGSQLSFNGIRTDPPVNIETGNITNLEAGVSALFYSDAIWTGMNAGHIPLTRNTFTGGRGIFPFTFMAFGGIMIKKIQGRLLYDRTYIYLSGLFKYVGISKQLDLGVYWARKGLEFGLWYRGLPFIKNSFGKFSNSALIFKAGMEFRYYMIGYSYDLSLVSAGFRAGGAHEVSMVYFFDLTDDLRKKKHPMVPAPRF